MQCRTAAAHYNRGVKVLFLATYPEEGASSRLRITQFFPYLERHGVECTFRPLFDTAFYRAFYRPGGTVGKALRLLRLTLARLGDVVRASAYDVVFIQREAHIIGPPILEWLLAHLVRRPLVFDFDDAVFLPSSSGVYGRLATLLKRPAKTTAIIRWSDEVIVCTEYSRRFVVRDHPDPAVIPTVVDSTVYAPVAHRPDDIPTIGWIGSFTAAPFVLALREVFERLGQRHRYRLKLVGLGMPFTLESPNVEVVNVPWVLDREVADYQSLDIGIYPLIADPWTEGKMGFKVVAYMSVGVPSVSSPIGDHVNFVREGDNGFFASTPDEWVAKLGRLLEDPTLRAEVGRRGRRTVEDYFSVERQAPRLLEVLRRAAGHRERNQSTSAAEITAGDGIGMMNRPPASR
jgi:glycosyltransferase involved in cell wall biosynthesis